jgi:hypothetical protein
VRFIKSNTEVLFEVSRLCREQGVSLGPVIVLRLDRTNRTVTDMVTDVVVMVPDDMDLT